MEILDQKQDQEEHANVQQRAKKKGHRDARDPKKDPGADPKRLTNAEKAAIIKSLRPKRRLKELLALMGMAKSSYEYAAAALGRPESAERANARENVIKASDDSSGTYGYRRIVAQTGIGEWICYTMLNKSLRD